MDQVNRKYVILDDSPENFVNILLVNRKFTKRGFHHLVRAIFLISFEFLFFSSLKQNIHIGGSSYSLNIEVNKNSIIQVLSDLALHSWHLIQNTVISVYKFFYWVEFGQNSTDGKSYNSGHHTNWIHNTIGGTYRWTNF